MRYRIIVKIEDHVSKLKIKNWENSRTYRYLPHQLTYKGVADGNPFKIETDGHQRIGDIVDRIVEQVTNEH